MLTSFMRLVSPTGRLLMWCASSSWRFGDIMKNNHTCSRISTMLQVEGTGSYNAKVEDMCSTVEILCTALAYPGGVLRVLEHPPKRFLLGVAIGFIPLQTTSLNIQSSFTQLHRLRGKKATRCHTSLRLGQSSPRA
jgi:hypothetical protein